MEREFMIKGTGSQVSLEVDRLLPEVVSTPSLEAFKQRLADHLLGIPGAPLPLKSLARFLRKRQPDLHLV